MHEAAKAGDIETVRKLLQNGADPNQYNKEGWTPLTVAAYQRGRSEICQLLIDYGAHVDARTSRGQTPLYFATALTRDDDCVDVLVSAGADVNGTCGWTTFLGASSYFGRIRAVKLFLRAGANVNAADERKWTPLDYACNMAGNGEVIRTLVVAGAKAQTQSRL